MVIDRNEVQARTFAQVRQVLAGTRAMALQAAADERGRYAWLESVLKRFEYHRLPRADRGPALAYLQRLSGYSRAQITRPVSRWDAGKPLVKNCGTPRHPFARLYTPADVALLVDVHRAMGAPSGPATACVLRRQRDVFGDERFEPLGSISVGHLYNLRHSAGYRSQRVVLTKTQPTKNTRIGMRKAPAPEGRPGFIRIDSVHPGDLDGVKGPYHINAVDCVTQWQVVASVQAISEAHLLSVIEEMLARFPFEIPGFHADNGSEYVNHKVARMFEKLRIEFHPQLPPAQQRQWPGRDQERRRGAQGVRLRAHPSPPCRSLRHPLPRIPQCVPELPPAVSVCHRTGRPLEIRANQARIPTPAGRPAAATACGAVRENATCRWSTRSPRSANSAPVCPPHHQRLRSRRGWPGVVRAFLCSASFTRKSFFGFELGNQTPHHIPRHGQRVTPGVTAVILDHTLGLGRNYPIVETSSNKFTKNIRQSSTISFLVMQWQ